MSEWEAIEQRTAERRAKQWRVSPVHEEGWMEAEADLDLALTGWKEAQEKRNFWVDAARDLAGERDEARAERDRLKAWKSQILSPLTEGWEIHPLVETYEELQAERDKLAAELAEAEQMVELLTNTREAVVPEDQYDALRYRNAVNAQEATEAKRKVNKLLEAVLALTAAGNEIARRLGQVRGLVTVEQKAWEKAVILNTEWVQEKYGAGEDV